MERYLCLSWEKTGASDVNNYKIVLKATGRITQLPDSQKVFGALVTMLAEAKGDEDATALVKAIFNKRMHLALSNVMPLGYFPMPQDYVVDLLAKRLPDAENLKKQRAAVKERRYVKAESMKNVLECPELCGRLYPYIRQSDGQQLRASVDSVMHGIEGLETKLYTVPILNFDEMRKDGGGEIGSSSVSDFCFYLQQDESMGRLLLDIIERLLRSGVPLILGKRASQGLNKYRVIAVEEIELPKGECYLNLGMLLPDKIDFKSSTIKLFTSERRPFVMAEGWNRSGGRCFISFIDSGSIIALRGGITQAGKCVISPFNKDRDIVFGNSFLYPFSLGKKGER